MTPDNEEPLLCQIMEESCTFATSRFHLLLYLDWDFIALLIIINISADSLAILCVSINLIVTYVNSAFIVLVQSV